MDKNEIVEQMNGFLHDTLVSLCSWLKKRLQRLSMDYWDGYVLSHLSDMQLHDVRENHITELDDLDLAGLLRVTRGNWKALNSLEPLPKIMYEYLEAMGIIRNNWAHIHTDLPEDKQVINELKVMEKFLEMISAPLSVSKEVNDAILRLENHLPLDSDTEALMEENEMLEDENRDLKEENGELRKQLEKMKK